MAQNVGNEYMSYNSEYVIDRNYRPANILIEQKNKIKNSLFSKSSARS